MKRVGSDKLQHSQVLQSRQHQITVADVPDPIVRQRQRPQRRQPRQPRRRQRLDGIAVQIKGLEAAQRLEYGPIERYDTIVAQIPEEEMQVIFV